MFYVSSMDRVSGLYGVTDTDDGKVDYVSGSDILRFVKELGMGISGVTGNTISVVSAISGVVKGHFDHIGEQVRQIVSMWPEERCMELARSIHFVKQIRNLPIDEMRRITCEYVYPSSVQDVIKQAEPYTNQVHSVDVKNREAVIQALREGVCLVLQHKTNGALTAFVCTGSLAVEDSIYQPGFFDAVYLTKQLYGYTYNIERVRPKREAAEKNPSMLNVFSCMLRFRADGTHHDKGNRVLSSPFYTLNLDNLFAMYVLDNPVEMGNTILDEFKRGEHTGVYDFDFKQYKEVQTCIRGNKNYFMDEAAFLEYVPELKLNKGVSLTDVMERFDSDFHYMQYLRANGYSFSV